MRLFHLFFILFSFFSIAAKADDEGLPLWEYGVGMGYVRYAQYPASDQYSEIGLPFPTFQYRGKILRADDRDGGRAYLLKTSDWSLEFSGGGTLPVDSAHNGARQGMADLPLVAELGPQIVYAGFSGWELKLALFPAFSAQDFNFTKTGAVGKVQATYQWTDEVPGPLPAPLKLVGKLILQATTGSQDFNANYYEVSSADATADRSSFNAHAGLLEEEISYLQTFRSGRASLYMIASYSDYSNSANKQSPLFRSRTNVGCAIGLTYVLGESVKRQVPVEDTEGVVNKVIQERRERN